MLENPGHPLQNFKEGSKQRNWDVSGECSASLTILIPPTRKCDAQLPNMLTTTKIYLP